MFLLKYFFVNALRNLTASSVYLAIKQFVTVAISLQPKSISTLVIAMRKLHLVHDVQLEYLRMMDPKYIEEILFERTCKTLRR